MDSIQWEFSGGKRDLTLGMILKDQDRTKDYLSEFYDFSSKFWDYRKQHES